MSNFASDEEKQEVLKRMARRYAHLKNRPIPDYIADTRRKRPEASRGRTAHRRAKQRVAEHEAREPK